MSSTRKPLKEPVSRRELTTSEKIILLEGSKLHSLIFPPWKADPEPIEFELPVGEAQYLESEDLPLSALQREAFDGWRRPHKLLHQPRDSCDIVSAQCGTLDLVQDVVSDCSVVASLCAVIARSERDNADLWKTSMHPYNQDFKKPAASSNGKYVFRFHFNGCHRRVVIDDRLPSSRTSQALHVIDRNNSNVYWPALIEKAYLKVRGGYDFPGSNSGTDLWILTGWLPEQLFLQSDEVDCDALWRRVLKAFNYGDVLVTMGTGKLTEAEEQGMGLIGEHDYAIIDIKEAGGERLFLVKNPWSKGKVWKGHIRHHTPECTVEMNMCGLQLQDSSPGDRPSQQYLAPGTFWMPLNDVFQSFESIYLNWNPALFSYREDFHFRWDLSEPDTSRSDGCVWTNPQYSIRSKKPGVVWLLLNRHFSTSSQKGNAQKDSGFISLYAFNNNGQRVVSRAGAIAHGPYVDSPNALLKVDLALDRALTIVVSEQDLPSRVDCFSLSAFSFAPLEMALVNEKYSHNSTLDGSWTATTSGGNTGSSLYHVNPQFSISLAQASDISLLLRAAEGWPVHVNLVWARGRQVRSVITRDVIADSGEYRNGFASAEIRDVPMGTYTIVCSTFEQGQTGKFRLSVGTMVPCQVSRVAVPTAGRFVTQVENAVLTPKNDYLAAPLMIRRLVRISLSAKSCMSPKTAGRQHSSPLRVSIEQGRGPTTRTIAASGEDDFGDAHGVGVHIPDVDILPEMCARGLWIVLDRLGSCGIPHDEIVEVQVLSDGPVEVGGWLQEKLQ